MNAVEVNEVSFSYRNGFSLRDISFSIERGEFFGLVGPNGAGKTTLLHIIDGIARPAAGRVTVEGLNPHECSRREIARKVAIIHQEISPAFPISCWKLVLQGRWPFLSPLKFEGKEDFRITEKVMEETGTLVFRDRFLETLSGGEKKKVMIARALAQQPELLLLDEPVANLDIAYRTAVLSLLRRLNREQNRTILIVTHELNIASDYCDRISLIDAGRMILNGSPEEVLTKENIERFFHMMVHVDENPVTGRPRITPIPE